MLSYDLEDARLPRQNLYMPIPYQKSCKIVADKGWGSYYHFTYATLPQGDAGADVQGRRWRPRKRRR